MDGVDRSFVESLEGELKTINCLRVSLISLQDSRDKLVRRMALLERSQGLAKKAPDSVPQLRRRQLGISCDQDILHLQPLFEDEPENNARDGISLPRPGAGFNQGLTESQRSFKEVEFSARLQCSSALLWWNRGRNMRRAISCHFSSSGSLRFRKPSAL